MIKKLILALSLFILSNVVLAQTTNNTCANAQPFCTGQTMNFPAGVNAGSAQSGPSYGCLGSQPNPAWFYMQIATGGPLVITMSANQDIDFICWGPFPNLSGACSNLTAGNTVGCSYSGSSTETCTIANAIPGQFYMLLITNFSNSNQNITFQQTNSNNPGAAQTNCGVLCSLTVTGTSSLCSGNTATLGATSGTQVVSVTWQGPAGYTSPIGNTSVPNMTASGVYTAIATTTGTNPATNTCSVTKSITVVPNPTPVVNNNGPICANATASLTVSGGGTYLWSGPNSFASNLSNPTVPNAQSANGGVYSVTVTANTCTAVGTTSLQVKPNPTVTASNSGSYCVGQGFTLTSTGATTYSWSGPSAYTSTLQTSILTNNVVGYTGTYTVLGTTNGCTATATTPVTINPLPNITASSSNPNICQNGQLVLSAAGGTFYTWTGPANFVSIQTINTFPSAQPNMTGTYTIVGVDANGCVNTTTLGQVVNPNPVINVTGSNACFNDQLALNSIGGTSYAWTGPNGYTSNQQNPVINNVTFGNAGNYTVVVTGPGGCATTGTTSCNVYPLPTVGFLGNSEVCKGGSFSWIGTGGLNYKWMGTFGVVSITPSFSVSSVSPHLQNTYTVVGVDANGCANTAVIYPVVLPLPAAQVIPDKDANCIPFCTKFNLNKVSSNITNANWVFSNGAAYNDSTQVTYCVTSAGVHTLNINLTDAKGCKSVINNTVLGYPLPQADFVWTPDSPTDNDYNVSFYDQTKNASVVEWNWDFFSNGQHLSTQQNPSYLFPEIGNYFVFMKVKSDHGCLDSIVKKLTVAEDVSFYVPNAFTPNGDGLNEVFTPKAVGVKKYKMEIFDRWGEALFSTTDITVGWDGKSKKGGDILPQGVYIYKITVTLNNGGKAKLYTGHVTLLR